MRYTIFVEVNGINFPIKAKMIEAGEDTFFMADPEHLKEILPAPERTASGLSKDQEELLGNFVKEFHKIHTPSKNSVETWRAALDKLSEFCDSLDAPTVVSKVCELSFEEISDIKDVRCVCGRRIYLSSGLQMAIIRELRKP